VIGEQVVGIRPVEQPPLPGHAVVAPDEWLLPARAQMHFIAAAAQEECHRAVRVLLQHPHAVAIAVRPACLSRVGEGPGIRAVADRLEPTLLVKALIPGVAAFLPVNHVPAGIAVRPACS